MVQEASFVNKYQLNIWMFNWTKYDISFVTQGNQKLLGAAQGCWVLAEYRYDSMIFGGEVLFNSLGEILVTNVSNVVGREPHLKRLMKQ